MEIFWEKKIPYGQIFTNIFQSPTCGYGSTCFCANFVKFGRPEVGEIARCLMDKKNSARAPAAASARTAPKICQGQLQTTYSKFPKFHPNPFSSGGVIAERVNIVQTRHKVFAILGEASASSPSNNDIMVEVVNRGRWHDGRVPDDALVALQLSIVVRSGTWTYSLYKCQIQGCFVLSLFCIKTPIFCIIYHGFRLLEQYEAEYVLDRAQPRRHNVVYTPRSGRVHSNLTPLVGTYYAY